MSGRAARRLAAPWLVARAARRLAAPWLVAACAACAGSPAVPAASPEPPDDAPAPANAPAPAGALADVEAALRAGDATRALAGARRVLAAEPRNAQANFYAGVALETLGDPPGAEAHYRRALEADPALREAGANLSALLLGGGRAAEARAVVEPLAARFPDDADLHINRAEALAALGEHAAAARAYEALLRRGEDARYRLGLAKALAASGDKAGATRVLREGARAPGADRDRLAAFGRALGGLGAYADAVDALDRALALGPGADLLTYRALFRRSAGNPKAAKADLEAAIALDPNLAAAHHYLGEVLESLGDAAGARRSYERAERAGGPFGERARARLEALAKKR